MSSIPHPPIIFARVRTLALALPEVEEGTSYGNTDV